MAKLSPPREGPASERRANKLKELKDFCMKVEATIWSWPCYTALETTNGQMDGFFSQLSYKCHQNRVASVGDWLKICPWVASRVGCGGVQGGNYTLNASFSHFILSRSIGSGGDGPAHRMWNSESRTDGLLGKAAHASERSGRAHRHPLSSTRLSGM